MARSGDLHLFPTMIMLLWMWGVPAHAQPAPYLLTMGPIAPFGDDIQKFAATAKATNCQTPDCVAITTIDALFDIFLESMATTQGVTRPLPIAKPSRINQLIRTALLDHPSRFPAICARAKDLASRYERAGVSGDLFAAVSIIQIAWLMDVKDHGGCLPTVLAAMPHTPDSDTAIANAHTLCVYMPWHGADCGRIARNTGGR